MKRIILCVCLTLGWNSVIAAEKANKPSQTAVKAQQVQSNSAQQQSEKSIPKVTETSFTGTQSITDFLPKSDKVTGTVMKLDIEPNYIEIAKKLQKAIQANQAWFVEYSKNAKPDVPLPYDEKMGITKEEYQKLLEADKNIALKEDKKIDIAFSKMPDGKILITTTPDSPIDKIVIDEKNGITTNYGVLKDITVINNQDKNSVTGPWKGTQWKTETMDAPNKQVKAIKFALGNLIDQDKNILYYDVLDINKDKKEQFSYIVFYPKS